MRDAAFVTDEQQDVDPRLFTEPMRVMTPGKTKPTQAMLEAYYADRHPVRRVSALTFQQQQEVRRIVREELRRGD